MAQTNIDLSRLSKSISDGIIAGTAGVVNGFAAAADKRHDLRGVVDLTQNKVYDLDGEVKLLKGMMTSLIGTGDGSTGMVPRLEKDMASVKGDVQELRSSVSEIKSDVGTLLSRSNSQTSWIDGWKGVGIFLGLMATCITVIGGIAAALLWLYKH